MSNPPHCHVCLIGSAAAGKTVFLAGLLAVSDPTRKSTITARPAGESYDRLRALTAALRDGHWPPATDSVTTYQLPVHVAAGALTRILSLSVLDYAGELMRELAALRTDKLQEVYMQMRRAEFLILLLDPADLQDRTQVGVDKLVALLTAVEVAWVARREGKPVSKQSLKDVALVLTKADLYPELTDQIAAENYIAQHGGELLQRMRPHARTVRVFALSSTGPVRQVAEGRTSPGPDLQPKGFDELFGWIVARRLRKASRRAAVRVAVILVPIFVVGLVVWGVTDARAKQTKQLVLSPTLGVFDRIRAGLDSNDPDVQHTVRQLIDEELARLGQLADNAVSEQELANLHPEISKLREVSPPAKTPACEDLNRKVSRRIVDLTYVRAKQGFGTARQEFVEKYPGDPRAEEIRQDIRAARQKEVRDARAAVKHVAVTDQGSLVRKRDEVALFLKQYEKDLDSQELTNIQSAVNTATKLLSPTVYTIHLSSSGEFDEERWHEVKMFAIRSFVGSSRVDNGHKTAMHDHQFKFSWTAGQELTVELHANGFFIKNTKAAEWSDLSPHAIFKLRGKLDLTKNPKWESHFEGDPFVSFDKPGPFSDDEIKNYNRYITPGDGW